MKLRNLLVWFLAFWVTACSTAPAPPDWQLRARQAIDRYGRAWLEGDTKQTDALFVEARGAIAVTGQLPLDARLGLIRCAYHVAVLDSTCQWNSRDLQGPDLHYAFLIEGRWDAIDPQHIDPRYRALIAARNPAQQTTALQAIVDPLSRLIAAGALFKRAESGPVVIQIAIDTASSAGWRRPLLVWLRVAHERAQQRGDAQAVADLQRRIAMVIREE